MPHGSVEKVGETHISRSHFNCIICMRWESGPPSPQDREQYNTNVTSSLCVLKGNYHEARSPVYLRCDKRKNGFRNQA